MKKHRGMGRGPRTGGRSGKSGPKPWLLLTHQLPPEPAYLRVKVRRQLERIGAVALKNSVYVLPPGEETREDFEWLAREIERAGGETTLCSATFLDATTDGRIVAAFREARARDYAAVAEEARALHSEIRGDPMRHHAPAAQAKTRKLRSWMDSVRAIDWFDAEGREDADEAIAASERALGEGVPATRAVRAPRARPRGGTWVTRTGPKVDRMSSAWLIRRFIDPRARFKCVPARGYRPAKGELRFDMFDGEFTHENDGCTFETLLAAFGLDDPALRSVADIVHDIDLKDSKFGRPETAGIASLVDGIVRSAQDDDERLRRGAELFDGLYEHFRRA